MTVLAEILSWSKTRPKWQQDALRRIVQGVELDAQQIDELTSLPMQECIATTNADVMPCTPLSEEHIAGLTATSETVVLRAIGNLKNVNALASGHTLQFAESGITVIYDDNGAGKSGYPQRDFSVIGEGAKCVLCQQPLLEDGAQRLEKLEKFVQRQLQRDAETAKSIYAVKRNAIEQLDC